MFFLLIFFSFFSIKYFFVGYIFLISFSFSTYNFFVFLWLGYSAGLNASFTVISQVKSYMQSLTSKHTKLFFFSTSDWTTVLTKHLTAYFKPQWKRFFWNCFFLTSTTTATTIPNRPVVAIQSNEYLPSTCLLEE